MSPLISYSILFGICTYSTFIFGDDFPDDKIVLIILLGVFSIFSLIEIGILFYLTILKRTKKLITLPLFGVLSFAPFLLVSPCGYRCCFFLYFSIMITVIYTIKFAVNNYGFKLEKLYNISALVTIIFLFVYIGLYAKEKRIYNYKTEYFKTSYYLPSANKRIVSLGDTAIVWDSEAGFEHEYVPLEEFEKTINNIHILITVDKNNILCYNTH